MAAKTQKQIQNSKKEDPKERVLIINKSKQNVPINTRAANGVDFYIGEQQYQLKPGNKFTFFKHRLYSTQINRLQKKGFITVMSIKENSEENDIQNEDRTPKVIRKQKEEKQEKQENESTNKKTKKKRTKKKAIDIAAEVTKNSDKDKFLNDENDKNNISFKDNNGDNDNNDND